MFRFLLASLFLLLALHHQALAQDKPISVKQAVTQPQLEADYRFRYGPRPFQFGDLRLPKGNGPYPVALVIHGGCWQSRYGLHLMDALSQNLTDVGFATWNIEFRRLGNKSGGWPGTFQDILLATAYLGNLSTQFALDLERVTVIGHSSGGHLALWLAENWSAETAKKTFNPSRFGLSGVVALAPVADLQEVFEEEGLGCHTSVQGLLGGSPKLYPQRYRLASPVDYERLDVPQLVISGAQDAIIPTDHVKRYYLRAKQRGDQIRYLDIGGAGHFELIAPESRQWPEIIQAITDFTTASIKK